MRRCAVILVLLAASVVQLSAQTNAAAMAARRWRQQHERAVAEEFLALPALPNVANGRAGIARNAAAFAEMLRRRGPEPQRLSVDGSDPVVFGQIRTPQATRTIVLGANRALFAGGVWLIYDGTRYPGNLPLVTFGARRFISTDIAVYGTRRELHGGNFGNWAPNPALALARLLASMKNDNGRVQHPPVQPGQ